MTAPHPARRLRDAMPVDTASRLVSDFLARHGAGLSDLAATQGANPASEAFDRLRNVARTQPRAPAAIGDALEALRDSLDAQYSDPSLPASRRCKSDTDAAVRWYAARLTELARFCRRL